MTAFVPALRAQESPAQTPETKTEKFAGTVVELTADNVTVVRHTVGAKSERHTFLIGQDTHVEGKLRVKARVTIGYVKTDDGDVANLIVVRATQPKKP